MIGQLRDSRPVRDLIHSAVTGSRMVARLAVIPGQLTVSCRFKSCRAHPLKRTENETIPTNSGRSRGDGTARGY